ncbi:unnamed protein product [Scytosiphon promiscuus]
MSGLWAGGASRRRSVGESTKDRRPKLKALAAESAQERRRQEFICSQKRVRESTPKGKGETSSSCELSFDTQVRREEASAAPWRGHNVDGDSSTGGTRGDEGDGMAIDGSQVMGDSSNAAISVDAVPSHNSTSNENEPGIEENGSSSGSGRGGGRRGRSKGKRGIGGGGSNGAALRAIKRRDHWANQLCTPEWMLTVPSDLNGAGSPVGAGWYVMARPEGKRVLVISTKGETVARQMSGAITHRFSSNLPGGSAAGRRGGSKGGGYCILDCVFHELDQTFFVLDMMAWKSYPLYDCNTDFRFYWVRTKLMEADGPLDTVSSRNAYRIKATPYHECDRQGLAHAYSSPMPFIKDGLLFHLKAAHYQLGPTPLVLMWKDASVTRYLGLDSEQAVVLKVGDAHASADEDVRGGVTVGGTYGRSTSTDVHSAPFPDSEQEAAFARSGGDGQGRHPLLTAEGVWVGEVGPEGTATYVPQAKSNDLLRFKLTGAEEELLDQSEPEEGDEGMSVAEGGGAGTRGIVHGLRFDKRCSKLRPMADTWSKVLFQTRLRLNSGISIDDIDVAAKSIPPTSTTLIPITTTVEGVEKDGHAVIVSSDGHGPLPPSKRAGVGDDDDYDDDEML